MSGAALHVRLGIILNSTPPPSLLGSSSGSDESCKMCVMVTFHTELGGCTLGGGGGGGEGGRGNA
jgi:hypothetical protein